MSIIIPDLEQGSPEWLQARCGVVSASNFNKIVTSTGKVTTGETRKKYLYQVVAEGIAGEPEETFKSEWMERGNELEAEARALFEMMTNLDVHQVGMVYLDPDKRVSCSPDGLIGDDSGYETKCPKMSTHIGYIQAGKLPAIYKPQVQGSMWVTGRKSWWFQSYHPKLPYFALQIKRDEEYIELLSAAVLGFVGEVDALKNKVQEG